jgi:hypothetical protein
MPAVTRGAARAAPGNAVASTLTARIDCAAVESSRARRAESDTAWASTRFGMVHATAIARANNALFTTTLDDPDS